MYNGAMEAVGAGSSDTVSSGDIITGAIIILVGGCMQGFFTAPMKATVGWEWENHWLLYTIVGTLVMPWIIVILTVPEWQKVYAGNATDAGHEASDLGVPFGLGFIWGVGGVTFGLGCDMVGNSLGFSIILGMCSALGAAIPLVALHPHEVGSKQGIFTWIGLAIVSVGLYFLAVAGMSKEKEQSEGTLSEKSPLINASRAPVYEDEKSASAKKAPPSFKAGLLMCVLSGIFSPMLNVAVNFNNISKRAKYYGADDPTASNANWAVIVLGGFWVQFAYCIYKLCTNGTWHLFFKGSTTTIIRNWFLGILMGMLWFGGNVMYTLGANKMGPLGTIAGWPMLMVCMVLSANGVALVTGEWKGTTSKSTSKLIVGLIILVIAAIVGQLGTPTGGGAASSSVCTAAEYCCPVAKHCLTPTNVSCAADTSDKTACSKAETCCPLTKVCVKVGAACDSPCKNPQGYASTTEFCCADTKQCLAPVDPGTLCDPSNATACGTSTKTDVTCCPLIKECVKIGLTCTPP